jgi:hypothetical protein
MNTRKITYHIFKFYDNNNINDRYEDFDFNGFARYLNNLEDENKRFSLNPTKFCSLDFIREINQRNFEGRQKCFFGSIKSASFGTRRELLNYQTNKERENPKLLTEGEKEQNYFILAFNNDSEFEIIFQNAHLGISANQFKNYLEKFMWLYLQSIDEEKEFKTEMGDIIIDDPEEIINRLDRIVECKVYIDKEVLGSDFLQLTNRTLNVKEDLVVDIKADIRQSIAQLTKDIIQNLAHDNRISKVWVRGKDNNSNESKFFIEKIMKSKYITVTLDPNTKSIVRDSIRQEMINLI